LKPEVTSSRSLWLSDDKRSERLEYTAQYRAGYNSVTIALTPSKQNKPGEAITTEHRKDSARQLYSVNGK